uniref:Cysteine-rich PDZ-binding protein n=1 Tax=Rhabditophanes sp. KR3021 TaxID=114890 RepID=A0AC35TJ80_9BILA
MVCEKCVPKLNKLVTSKKNRSGEKVVKENKFLSQKDKFKPNNRDDFKKCRICKKTTHQLGAHYCQECSYQKCICAMCGKKLGNVTFQRQSAT